MALFSSHAIRIELKNHIFFPGDTIEGNIHLMLSEPVKSDGVTLHLLGKNTRYHHKNQRDGRLQNEYFYNQGISLLGPGTYQSQVVPFRYTIPPNILPKSMSMTNKVDNLPTWLMMLVKIGLSIANIRPRQYDPEFSLMACVDIPWAIDVTEKINISIQQKTSL